jgi:hypothetical protein
MSTTPISATMSSTWASLRAWTNGLERATRRGYGHSFSLSMSKLAGAERTSRFTLQRMMAILP